MRRVLSWKMLSETGGGLATGSGERRAGKSWRWGSCAQRRKWVPSPAAMVAPYPCDCGQGRVGVHSTGASRLLHCRETALFLRFLLVFPRPQYFIRLYSSILTSSLFVQYRSRTPATVSTVGFEICPCSIHLCKVARCTPNRLAASEIENFSVIECDTMLHLSSCLSFGSYEEAYLISVAL